MSLLLRLKKLEELMKDRMFDKEEVRDMIFGEGSFERAMGLTEDELEECYQAAISGTRVDGFITSLSIDIRKSSKMKEDL